MAELEANWLDGYDFLFVADAPVCAHCHHYNLFIDKTVDDALGVVEGTRLRTETAREFFYQLLEGVFDNGEVDSAEERLNLASELFAACGHGQLDLSTLGENGGQVYGDHLHYSYSWNEKHAGVETRYHPADATAAGFAAAALALAYGHAPETVLARETRCLVLGHDRCKFELTIGDGEAAEHSPRVDRDSVVAVTPEPFGGIREEEVEELSERLKAFLAGVAGDERGLIQAFGVFVTFNPSNLYNRLSYDLLDILRREHPSYLEVAAGLLREAGRMCGFNTFGGIIRSPEWEALTGTGERDMLTVALHSTVIARGLGFGRWSVADFEPGRTLILQAPSTYEGPYHRIRHGSEGSASCFLFEGASEAIAQLGHAVDWSTGPEFSPAMYEEVFEAGNNPWRAEQTRCVCKGDDFCEVTVTHQG